MYKMTKEFYAPTNRGFSRKPYEVTEEVVTDEFFENYTNPAQTRFFNSADTSAGTQTAHMDARLSPFRQIGPTAES